MMIDVFKMEEEKGYISRYLIEPKEILFETIYILLTDSGYEIDKQNETIQECYDETYHFDEIGALWKIFEEKYGYEILKFMEEKANEMTEYMIKE